MLVPVGPSGELLIDYSIHDAARAGFRDIVVVTRPDIREELEIHLHDTWPPTVSFQFVYQALSDRPAGSHIHPQRETPWGTGHAVLAVRNIIHEPFVVINCDDFYGRTAYNTAANHLRTHTQTHALVGYRLDETLSPSGGVSRADCTINRDGTLERLTEMVNIHRERGRIIGETIHGERRIFSGTETVSMNFWAFHPDIFQVLGRLFTKFLERSGHELGAEFLLSNAINEAITDHEVSVAVLASPDPWFGMTYPNDLPSVVSSLDSLTRDQIYPSDIASLARNA